MTLQEKLERLKDFDTPSITNVVATYPADTAHCLGLYNPWKVNWYTDETCRCMFPGLGRTVGFAVTAIQGLPDPSYHHLDQGQVFRAVAEAPKPCVLVMQQDMPEPLRRKNRAFGGNMTTALKALGCVGVVSDGPMGDLDEIREMGFQYLVTGATAGHGDQSTYAVNVPVSVCGMDVCPGEIIHMDENGAVKFPAAMLDAVLDRVEKLAAHEKASMEKVKNCANVDEVLKAMGIIQ